jgi:putative transposase
LGIFILEKLNCNFGFLQMVFVLLSRFYMPRYDVRIQLLKYQVKMLRDRIDEPRIIPAEVERAELMRLGALIDHQISDVMLVVKPDTYSRVASKEDGQKTEA